MIDKNNAPMNEATKKFNYIDIIPKELQNAKIFVCYDSNKKPYSPINFSGAKANDPNTFGTLYEALQALKKCPYLKGIGIELGNVKNGRICGLDIDNCIDENGIINPQAQELINLLNTYTEISISGKGIHCLFYATKKGDICKNYKLNWCKCLEMYDNGRYFALTGNVLNNKGIEYRQEQCNYIYKKYFNIENKTINCAEIAPIRTLTKEKIEDYEKHFQFALSVDSKLLNYWQGKRPTNDESGNDNGFIKKLAYWLNDYNLIKEYFLKSPYFRQKDQKHKDKCLVRKDYLHTTILKALKG